MFLWVCLYLMEFACLFFSFKQMIGPVAGSGLPSMFPTSVWLLETLPCHLDLACVCVIHCPVWDLGSDLFQSANLKAIAMRFWIRSAMNSLEMSPNVIDHFVVPLYSTSFPLQSLWQSLIHWSPLLLSSSQKSRTLVPLLCWVLPVTVQSQAVEDQRGAAVMRIHLLVLRTTLLFLESFFFSQSFRCSPLPFALWHCVIAWSGGKRDQKKKNNSGDFSEHKEFLFFAP